MITSNPTAPSTLAADCVALDKPPSWPREDIDLMNTPSSSACSCIRIRSPSRAPPVTGDDGSTASTATRKLCLRYSAINAPVVVDLPTPGGPVTPISKAELESARSLSSSVTSGVPSSMTLNALPKARTSPATAASSKECIAKYLKEL